MSVSLKRGIIAAALTGLLAVSVVTPAAIAAADELPADDTTTTVVDEQAPAEPTPEGPAEELPAEEPAAEGSAEEPAEEPAAEEPSDEPAEEQPADAPQVRAVRAGDVPTPTATSTNDPDPDTIAPGATLEVPYTVAGARYVYVWAEGDDLEVTITRPGGGGRTPVTDFGSYHQSTIFWQGMPDGVWTLTLRNVGAAPVTPDYDVSYTTADWTLDLSTSVGAPGLNLHTIPVINGVSGPDFEVHSEIVGPDGTWDSHDLELQGTRTYTYTYPDLPNGTYLARVWIDHEGVRYENSVTVRVNEAETEPPVMSASTLPAAPNAAGWFRQTTVRVTLAGADSGSGYWQGYFTLDGGGEQVSYPGTSFNVTGEGEHTITYRGRDAQGNFSEWAELPVRIDTVHPDISLHGIVEGANYDIGEEVIAEYQCTDATSGLDTCIGDRPDMGRIDTSERGSFTFAVVATDNAGNSFRVWRNYTVGPVDTTDPVVDAEVPEEPASGWYAGPVTIALTASDDDTGVARVHWEYYTETGTVSGDATTETTEFTIDRTGEFQVTYWAQDAAGNRSEGRTLNLAVDVDRPVIDIVEPQGDAPSILPNGHYAQNERVVVDFTCDDIGSGIDTCTGPVAAGATLPTATPGTHEFRVVATDLAGNRTENWVVYTVDAAPAPGGGNSGGPAETPRLAQTGSELLIPGVILVAGLLAAGALLLATRRLGGR